MMNPGPAQFGGSFQQPAQQPRGCWGRNWRWLVPTGCLALLIGVGGVVALIAFGVVSAVKSSEVYRSAFTIARTHPAAIERLGEPIEDGWFVKGSVQFKDDDNGNANFEIPLKGPKKNGRLEVWAKYERSQWFYYKLDLKVEGTEPVSLLDQRPRGVNGDAAEDSDSGAEAPPPPVSPAGTVIAGGVLNGKAVSKPAPPYPQVAKAAGAHGTVTVQVIVDEKGEVVSAKAVSGHPLLRQAAEQAARRARFAPTILSGKPVKVSGVLTYNFVTE